MVQLLLVLSACHESLHDIYMLVQGPTPTSRQPFREEFYKKEKGLKGFSSGPDPVKLFLTLKFAKDRIVYLN